MTIERFTVGRAMPAAPGGARPTKDQDSVLNFVIINNPKYRSCHPAHASIHLAAQGTQHERGGHHPRGCPFALSSPHSGRIEGLTPFNCDF